MIRNDTSGHVIIHPVAKKTPKNEVAPPSPLPSLAAPSSPLPSLVMPSLVTTGGSLGDTDTNFDRDIDHARGIKRANDMEIDMASDVRHLLAARKD
jgi:hypothetical protein